MTTPDATPAMTAPKDRHPLVEWFSDLGFSLHHYARHQVWMVPTRRWEGPNGSLRWPLPDGPLLRWPLRDRPALRVTATRRRRRTT